MEQLVSNILSLVGSSKNGVSLNNILADYKSLTGQKLDYQHFGFSSLKQLLTEIDDLVLRKVDKEIYVFLRPADNAETLNNLVSLIQSTKTSKKGKGGVQRNTSGHNFSHSQSSNQSPYTFTNINRLSSNFETLKIKVHNDAYEAKENYSLVSNNNSIKNNINPQFPKMYGNVSSLISGNNNHNYINDYEEFNKNRSDESSYWLCHPKLSYNANNCSVHILGIQSGVAIVKSTKLTISSNPMKVNPVLESLPGDILLWQPAAEVMNNKNNGDYVDLNTVFVVVVLSVADECIIKVRLHGWKQSIDVNADELFYLPENKFELSRIFNQIQHRQVTAMTLIAVGSNLELWANIYNGYLKENLNRIYISHFIREEQSFLLEDSCNSGRFFNIDLVLYYLKDIAPTFSFDKRKSALKIILCIIEKYLDSLQKFYLDMMESISFASQDWNKSTNPINYIFNQENCSPRYMLIGCRAQLRNTPSFSKNTFTLQRMKYYPDRQRFYYYDTPNYDIESVELVSPICGIFVINENFIGNSTISKAEKSRFQLAFLRSIPPYAELKKLLKIVE